MKTPIICKMDAEELIKHRAPQYVPEWIYDEENPDSGVVLAQVLSDMYAGTVRYLNQIPDKYHTKFLNLLGTKLAPSISSKGMVTVTTTKGSKGTYVKKGSTLYGSGDDGDRVFFETADAMYALDVGLDTIFFTDGETDTIVKAYEPQVEPESYTVEPFRMFFDKDENLQQHIVYIPNSMLLLSKDKTSITLRLEDEKSLDNKKFLLEFFTSSDNVVWQYYSNEEWKDIEKVRTDWDNIHLEFDGVSDVYDLDGMSERFIRCIVRKIPESGLRLSGVEMSTAASDILPDITLCNSDELSKTDFFPFGDELATYTDFCIASGEVFAKKGADVSIDIEMQFLQVEVENSSKERNIRYKNIMDRSDFEEQEEVCASILSVVWEYWNGMGWSKLYKDDTNSDFFSLTDEKIVKKKLNFKCPENFEPISIGPEQNLYIRARIKKIRNPYDSFQRFIAPYIHEMKISYSYKDKLIPNDKIVVCSDLENKVIDLTVDGVKNLLKNTLLDVPAMYMCFTSPIDKGPFKMLFNIEETLRSNFPSIQWEYYSTDGKGMHEWQYVQVLDGTEHFKHSGIVTIMGRSDFQKTKLFGKEGYFIRLVNTDKKYRSIKDYKNFPQINSIYANTVTVLQKETRTPEYFATEKYDKNKVCTLAKPNIIDARVWVNEVEALTLEEQQDFIERADDDKIVIERDSMGVVTSVWVEWDEVSNLKTAGPNDRVYEVKYSEGEILFGDSIHGRIPPKREAKGVKIVYATSSGKLGNIDADKISNFNSAISFVSKVTNLKAMSGGIDQETIDQASQRISTRLAGMGKIVSIDDFEHAICYNNRNVYKVKCVPHIDYKGNDSPGTISIAVLPRQYMQGYEKFSLLSESLYDFVRERAPITLTGTGDIKIFEVSYVDVSVSLDVVSEDYDSCHDIDTEVRDLLEKLLDPIHGNFDKKGWDIGRIVTKEQIYNTIKSVKKIKWVKQANLFTKIVTESGKKDVDFDKIKGNPFVVPVCGDVTVNISVEEDEEMLSLRR